MLWVWILHLSREHPWQSMSQEAGTRLWWIGCAKIIGCWWNNISLNFINFYWCQFKVSNGLSLWWHSKLMYTSPTSVSLFCWYTDQHSTYVLHLNNFVKTVTFFHKSNQKPTDASYKWCAKYNTVTPHSFLKRDLHNKWKICR